MTWLRLALIALALSGCKTRDYASSGVTVGASLCATLEWGGDEGAEWTGVSLWLGPEEAGYCDDGVEE